MPNNIINKSAIEKCPAIEKFSGIEKWSIIRDRYLASQISFEQAADKLKKGGWKRAFSGLNSLLADSEELSREISWAISRPDKIKNPELVLNKIKKFEHLHRELLWSTTSLSRQWAGLTLAMSVVFLFFSFVGRPRIVDVGYESAVLSGDCVWENKIPLLRRSIKNGDFITYRVDGKEHAGRVDAIAGENAKGRINFVIPNESVWVSSDSFNSDSTNCDFRLVPCRGVDGVATRVLFSTNRGSLSLGWPTTWLSGLKHPRTLLSKVRWNRTLNRIRL